MPRTVASLALVSVCVALVTASAAAPPASVRKKPPARPAAKKTVPPPGPPKPPRPPQTAAQNAEARKTGARLLEFYRRGWLRLVNDERDKRYLKQLAAAGYYIAPDRKRTCAPSPALLRTFTHLAARSRPERPLVVLSLYRPPTTLRPRSAHGRGEALDISGYGGYSIDSRRPEECVNGTLAIVKALPAGRAYRLGLPKPPGTDPRGLEPPPSRGRAWPFFPAPLPRRTALFGRYVVVAPRTGGDGRFRFEERRGYWAPEVARWANENAAPLGEVTSPRVRRVLQSARRRGADVHMLFPDALDHVHLDVVRPRR